jgi:hypothetical protein
VVWSKADEIDKIGRTIKCALDEDLAQIFKTSQVFKVSNFSKADPDSLCHNNNKAVIEYLMEKLSEPKNFILKPQVSVLDDMFLNYMGAYACE